MGCERIEELLPGYLDGEVSAEEAGLVEEHLRECASCRSTLHQLRRVDRIVAAWPSVPAEIRPRLAEIDEGVQRRILQDRVLAPALMVLRLAAAAAIILLVGGLGFALLVMSSRLQTARQAFAGAPEHVVAPLLGHFHAAAGDRAPLADPVGLHPQQLPEVVRITVTDFRQASKKTDTNPATIRPALTALARARFVRHDPDLRQRVAAQTYLVQLGLKNGTTIHLVYLPSGKSPNVEDPRSQDWWNAPGIDAAMQPLLPNPPVGGTPVVVQVVPTPRPIIRATATPSPRLTARPTPSSLRALPAPVASLAVDPSNARTVYALLTTNALFRSADAGATWQRLPLPATEKTFEPGSPPPVPLISRRDLVIPAKAPNRVFVVAEHVLYGSDDFGKTWAALNDAVYAWTVADPAGNVLYAWHGGASLSEPSGLYRSRDGGATWQEAYPGVFPPLLAAQRCPCSHEGITTLAADPGDPNTLYAATDYGVFRSVDSGKSWVALNAGVPASISPYRGTPILIAAADGSVDTLSEILASDASSRTTLIRLAPGGLTWSTPGHGALTPWQNPNAPFDGFATLAADPSDPARLYLGTSRGLLVSDDAGARWRGVSLPRGKAVYQIALARGDASAGSSRGLSVLYLSTDAGLVVVKPSS